MERFKKLYEEEKILDDMFDERYDNNSIETIEKNIIGLLVELGELANEIRFFKYWSSKKPSNKDVILEEYSDCLMMLLSFCLKKGVSLNENFKEVKHTSLMVQFKELFKLVSNLDKELDKDLLKEILSNLINLGKLLNFTDEDIIEGGIKKMEKNKRRFEEGF